MEYVHVGNVNLFKRVFYGCPYLTSDFFQSDNKNSYVGIYFTIYVCFRLTI